MKNPFRATLLFLFFLASNAHSGSVVINEVLYRPVIKTQWIEFVELHNPGTETVNLEGWAFTAGIGYTFPEGTTIAPGGYLVLAKDPKVAMATFDVEAIGPFSGSLSNSGDRLRLVQANGEIADEVNYGFGFPWPFTGEGGISIERVNPHFDGNLGGNWRPSDPSGPTPGARNAAYAEALPPRVQSVQHRPRQPASDETVTISAEISDPAGISEVALHYQIVDPGHYIELDDRAYNTQWQTVPMSYDGNGSDTEDAHPVRGTFTVELPESLQEHRRLMRYRVVATNKEGLSITLPYPEDPQPNFAYFIYDGVPAWTGAVRPGSTPADTFDSEAMERLPVYHLIGKRDSIEAATWHDQYRGNDYLWTGTLVYDGKVYDHIGYRARGGVWRYAMGKNMWKFGMKRSHDFQAHDNYGKPFSNGWRRVNLGASIQQGNFEHRGEQGMFESVGFRLFNLAGVEASNTVFTHFRVISQEEESDPDDQYSGDFWGVYLAVEQPYRRLLREHGLPDGNIYKMENWTGEIRNLGPDGPDDKSDLNEFMHTYNNTTPNDDWWRENLNLPKYYSYQAIIQGIHHYDIADGKNYHYYRNSETGKWEVIPWDLDLTWADNMYRAGVHGGNEPFKSRVLTREVFNKEYRNRLREIRDLLFNTDQAFQVIDEYAYRLRGPEELSIIEADRRQWDYNPLMDDSRIVNRSKAGHGRFYQKAPSKDFEGMVQLMKDYVVYRNEVVLDPLAEDDAIPGTPILTSTGAGHFPVDDLRFRTSEFQSDSAGFASMKWRIAEVTDPDSADFDPEQPRKYEIEATWESGELEEFSDEITIPLPAVASGHRYRVRVQMKDDTGRTSHWSEPLEFVATEADFEITPHPLGEGPYLFSEWNADEPAGSYPPSMVFQQTAQGDPELGDGMDSIWTLPYNLNNRSRIVGLGEDGVAFINTANKQEEPGAGYLGAAVLALDTTGGEDIHVSWRTGAVETNSRLYGLRLQYRVGNENLFIDLLDEDGQPVEFVVTADTPNGHSQVLGPVALPAVAADQPHVELRWKYYFTGVRLDEESGQRSMLSIDDIAVTTGEAGGGERLIFSALQEGGQAARVHPPIDVSVVDADGATDITFNDAITLGRFPGDFESENQLPPPGWSPGEITGTLTRTAKGGVATFDDIVFSEKGSYRLSAMAEGVDWAVVSPEIQVAILTEVLMPRFIQGEQDADGNNFNRAPFAYRLRIDGLVAGATYRYGNRIIDEDDPPAQDGAGNMIFVKIDGSDFVRNTNSPRFLDDDFDDRHSTFVADAEGSYTGWFVTEPTGNPRIAPGVDLRMRVLLNDGEDGEETRTFLTAPSGVRVVEFGSGAAQASAFEGTAVSPPKNFVVIFDNVEGTGRPLSATLIERSGAAVDERYAAFYHERVAAVDGAFGALIPNDLPGGVRRIEERSLTTGELLSLALFPSGAPGSLTPSTGLVPITIDLREGGVDDAFSAWVNTVFPEEDRNRPEISGPDADPDADGIPNLLEYALGGDPVSPDRSILPRAEIEDDRLALSFGFDPTRPGISYIVEATTNLSDWSEILFDSRTDGPQPNPENGVITVPDSTPLSEFADGKRFLRLRIVLTE